jgi:diguanylate cyclase (GGDEF)-like protein/PAS domain S-box-containing protein
MDSRLDEPPLADRVSGWHATALSAVRIGVIALASLVLAFAGAFTVGLSPWGAMALPAGLAVAVQRRWGAGACAGALLGLWAALLSLSLPWGRATLAAALVGGGSWLAREVLRRLQFNPRLERPADVTALGLAVVFALALPVAAVLSPWAAPTGMSAVLIGWCVLALGAMAAAVATLAFDRSAWQSLQPGAPLRKGLTSSAALLVTLWLLWLAPVGAPGLAAVAYFLPLIVLTLLALREQMALAGCGLVAAGLLAASHASGPTLAAWCCTALLLTLLAHASTVQWRGRAQRWEWALDGSRLGVADWHLLLDDSFASAAWRTLSGHTARRWTPADWQAQVNAEDRPALAAAIASLSAGEAGRAALELRVPDGGGWRWAEATLMVIERDHHGHPVRLLATLSDMQDKREALERQRMSTSLFQHLHEGLLITDPDLRALDANPAYTQILGVPREELIGVVPSLLRPTPADPVARQQRAAMWASLRDTGSWRGELLERRRNGETCMLQTTISTVHGPAGDLRYHVLVISDITEQQAQRDQLERQAHFDELTRLPNRARLSQLLDDAMRAADRDGYLLVVCYLDLDRFKPVNDRYGHAAGDRLLAELAGRLRSALRSREHWTDSAARLGGDEFVLLLRAGTLEEGRLAVERVLRVVSQPYVVDPAEDAVQVTASMGATVYPVDRSDADTLLRHADHAMYGAKQSGRNGYLFFDPEQRRRTEQRVMAIGRIQEALDQQEFVLHYQPKVDMRSGRVLGFEALLRWEHPQQGLVAPMQFLPLIENTGLSSRVGDWVISRALEHLSSWRRDGFDFSVSVNVSARHLQEPDFAQRLTELLARHAEPLASRLEIEMLETAAHADIEATSALLARCQGTGVRFALDDFGTGYSTLTYLKRLPVDVLKIDRSFVHHMLDDTQDRAIVEGVIGLARTFGCTVVAEGVESPAQARTLLELGCDIGQGTGIAAPMPVAQVAGWVREYKGMFALAPAAAPGPDNGVARLGG